MPRRTDLHRVLLLGSGPIVIGQAAEFDYSGTQAVKALKEEGYTVVLVDANPATIMTDPELAARRSRGAGRAAASPTTARSSRSSWGGSSSSRPCTPR